MASRQAAVRSLRLLGGGPTRTARLPQSSHLRSASNLSNHSAASSLLGVDDSRWSSRRHASPLPSVIDLPVSRHAAFSSSAADDEDKSDEPPKGSDNDKKTEAEKKKPEPAPAEPINKQTLEFQAETRQLLDIVTHSLYTDKEVFLRELISNASDALEKLRHVRAAGQSDHTVDPDVDLEIRVETDELNGTVTIADTGIGLTKDDMVANLGTIARSGSKAFVKELAEKSSSGADALDASKGIIGKFGVGFYSAFMVGDKVEVRSKSAYKTESDDTSSPLVWSSTGVGGYDIAELPSDVRQDRGSSVVVHLNEDHLEYSDEKRVETVLKKYSNFVNFPIYLNGNRVNTIEAIWSQEPRDVTEESYAAFYKYVANAYDDPLDRLHYRADAPIEIKALFYIPSFHSEKYGMGRMEPGVSLYSRKVLIESKSPDILPEWMRFVKGVVDSEDLPLSISREKPQDTALIQKLRKALTRKFISHLTKMARKQTDKFKDEFYKEYSFFLKEGICQDYEFQDQLSKLLYFETSKTMAGEISSLDEYVSRCTPAQKEIYYLCAPTRELALQSPYLEAFEKAGREVLFVYTAIDDFVMSNLETFEGRKLVTAEKSDIDLGDDEEKKKDADTKDDEAGADEESTGSPTKLGQKEQDDFCAWAKTTLGAKVKDVKITNRLGSSPAIVTDNESGAMRRMMRMVDTQDGGGSTEALPLAAQRLEVNPAHPVVVGMFGMRETDPKLAEVCLSQVFDNALVAAGLLDDGRSMLPRLNDLLLCVVKGAQGKAKVAESGTKLEADAEEKAEGGEKEPADAAEDDKGPEPEHIEAEFTEKKESKDA